MSEQISEILKSKLNELAPKGGIDAETKRNALKEELQYLILNFIYHHPEYSNWIMYGGSALRIIHGLDRMSIDLDFEVPFAISDKFLKELKKELEEYFSNTYGARADFLMVKITTGRGLLLKFNLGETLSFGHPSKQVHVKLDLNHFIAQKTVIERRPINRDQLSFVIVTYNMSALMASKIAAIFLRGVRGIGDKVYEEKGRDIYDLLWYMNKKVVPDIDYLVAKNIDIKDLRTLFDKLTVQMNKVNNTNLKNDLTPLFLDRTYIENWLQNWLESYLRYLDDYEINTVTELKNIMIHRDFNTDNYSFVYQYDTDGEKTVRIIYYLSEYWTDFRKGSLPIKIDKKIADMVQFSRNGWSSKSVPQDDLNQYATLFYEKTEKYLGKSNRIMLGNGITTKLIRMTADNLNQKEEIVLNISALLSCELDDLLK
ncbi:MAG: hypothetical protein US31_C0010G0018 [Berkelbacteria bacterium GW2011_GWA1_36_9]|uniref:Protein containing DUF1814 n=1 Tax=Berkelbacteria bacterium GW2011_GWA1_36_9 TaxID=1618331 RepID=A0A0G0I1I3_9BACT|nr:MAG: hypothetical protein US31_C0010G0018 [Berkelbacteria bacterium GW2011_GWA1_36_9]